jgi:light-regulated signal transduction histidine kinase (bacteriophytochrome)
MNRASASILVVDDMPDNLQVLSDILSREGFMVRPVTSAAMAFRTMAAALPELVLADIKMPGMDGYEFCRRLKADPETREIPVIFISALGETKDKLRAFEAGGVDYITKPFQAGEIVARVRTHLDIYELRCSLRQVNRELEARTGQLEAANRELEAFCYSVSHDLRAPLRGIDGFSHALLEDCQEQLDDNGRNHLSRICMGVQRMGQLIEDLLKLSHINRAGLTLAEADLSELCRKILGNLAAADPQRRVEVVVQPGLTAQADGRLLQVLAENLLGNAWKFTSRNAEARIEVGGIPHHGGKAFFIRDNGAGFDMAYVHKLFQAFQRLHRVEEFEGTGIGLAIVQRIVHRHGGDVWAEGETGKGACFFFSLGAQD